MRPLAVAATSVMWWILLCLGLRWHPGILPNSQTPGPAPAPSSFSELFLCYGHGSHCPIAWAKVNGRVIRHGCSLMPQGCSSPSPCTCQTRSCLLPIFQETFRNDLSPYCSPLKSIGHTVCTVQVRSLYSSASRWAWFACLPAGALLSAEAQGGSLVPTRKYYKESSET